MPTPRSTRTAVSWMPEDNSLVAVDVTKRLRLRHGRRVVERFGTIDIREQRGHCGTQQTAGGSL
jgi:hypothetical protein